ncbi:karyogamy protein KAR4 [Scheffersomyces amazonensis]|uniref:karyogamy protein KAR4 n=1 Tax=Scheffersomyces amazonensis TaxID=1078765 RepID=UPI00315C5DB2
MLPNKYTYNKYGTRSNQTDRVTKRSMSDSKIGSSVSYSSTDLRSGPSSSSSNTSISSNSVNDTGKSKTQEVNEMDFCNHVLHNDARVRNDSSIKYIRNVNNPFEGYPKLSKLHQLKRSQMIKHAVKPYGVRIPTEKIIPTLYHWIEVYGIKFDVIMIGALVENQFILPILNNIPFHKLCSKPGFLFIWATTQKIQELTNLLNNDNFNKKFRRSEELIFLPIDKDSPYFPGESVDESILLFERQQWHCWMCITGTVRRATDNHLIHCNVDTDLQIESTTTNGKKNAVPDALYRVAENFSNSNRRLHIIPSKTGYDTPVKLRPGWIIMSPDVMINNFNPKQYKEELYSKSFVHYKASSSGNSMNSTQGNGNVYSNAHFLVPQTEEIEELRPKSPVIASKNG